jgi:hypothetical protein
MQDAGVDDDAALPSPSGSDDRDDEYPPRSMQA